MHILHVVGARPNFIKAAPLMAALRQSHARQTLVHTGQHFDPGMSEVFFSELDLPQPDVNLGVGSGSHAAQSAHIMLRFEPVLLDRKPDLVVVYGDVNSTLSAALVATKQHVRLAHVEAGLRSGDRSMPEEINRILTDQLADLLFTPSADADANLAREGIPTEKICLVGNIMIDSLVRLLPEAEKRWQSLQEAMKIGRFALLTLHRPSNVDDPQQLRRLLSALGEMAGGLDLLFPVHPRTRRSLKAAGITPPHGMRLLEPLGYLDFLALQSHAAAVITDSGGIQEESTVLGVPCLTLRTTTERPVTVILGTNLLIGDDLDLLQVEMEAILAGRGKGGRIPPLWDGHTAERISAHILKELNQ